MLSSLNCMPDIVTPFRQDPVCFTKLDPDDVLRIWANHNKDVSAARGRGRGRSNSKTDDGLTAAGQTDSGDWAKGAEHGSNNRHDPWSSDMTADGAGDLSDLAAAALNFRAQLSGMRMERGAAEEEDMMVRLLREQDGIGMLPDETDDMPAWADEPIAEAPTSSTTKAAEPAVAAAPMPAAPAPAQPAFELDLLLESMSEWFYMDPQGKIQGPFTQDNMRLWHEGGYFPRDLPIKLRQWTSFHAFAEVFEDSRSAFFSVPAEPGKPILLNLPATAFSPTSAPPALSLGGLLTGVVTTAQRAADVPQPVAAPAVTPATPVAAPAPAVPTVSVVTHPLKAQASNTPAAAVDSNTAAAGAAAFPIAHSVAKSDFAKQLLGISPKAQASAPTVASSKEPPVSAAHSAAVVEKVQSTPALAPVASRAEPAESVAAVAAEPALKPVKGWNKSTSSSNANPQPNTALSLTEIQQQEEAARKAVAAARLVSVPVPTAAALPPAVASGSAGGSMSVQLKSLLGVKQPASVPAPGPAGPVWNSASQSAPAPSASLRAIMMEEMTQQQTQEAEKQSSVGAAHGSSWASKAKSGAPSVSAGASVRNNVPAATPVISPAPTPLNASKPAGSADHAAVQQQSLQQPQLQRERSEFGGKQMSKEMVDWCTAQLKRINGSDDITLMHFCMSLGSGAEIRETLSGYLGSSPQVTNFATDFIKFREEGRKPIQSAVVEANTGKGSNGSSGFVTASKKKKVTGAK